MIPVVFVLSELVQSDMFHIETNEQTQSSSVLFFSAYWDSLACDVFRPGVNLVPKQEEKRPPVFDLGFHTPLHMLYRNCLTLCLSLLLLQ